MMGCARTRLVACSLSLLFVVALPRPGLAQKNPREREARAHYEKGMKLYDEGQFAQAIEEFRAAYDIAPAPGLLFNLGQAFRLEKNYEMALYFYKKYLSRMPDAPNRADVERWMAEVEESLKHEAKPAPQPPPPAPTEAPPAPAPAPAVVTPAAAAPVAPVVPVVPVGSDHPDADGHGRRRRLTGLALAGAGVALVATGIAFGVAASSASDDLEAQARQRGSWSPQLAARYDDGQSDALRANVLIGVGGAAIVAGGIFYYLGWRDAQPARTLSFSPTRGGGAVHLSCAF